MGGWKIKGDQHLKYPDQTPLSNVLLTLLDRAGVPVEKVGDDGIRSVLGGLACEPANCLLVALLVDGPALCYRRRPTSADDGTTALHWAAHNNDNDAVDRLLKAGHKRQCEERVRRDAACPRPR